MTQKVVAVVDDDLCLREALQDFLESRGYASLAYSSALEFLAASGFEQADCVLLDIEMPEMSGLELLEVSVAMKSRPPVIIMSSRGDEETLLRARANGAAGIVTKPIDLEVFNSILATTLGTPAPSA